MRRVPPSLAAVLAAIVSASPGALGAPMGRTTEIACAPGEEAVAAALVDGLVWITRDDARSWTRAFAATEMRPTDEGDEPDPVLAHELGVMPDREEGALFTGAIEDPSAEAILARRETEAEDARPSSSEVLAVSDRGAWAVAVDGLLTIGGPGARVAASIEAGDLRGAVFDRAGRLWAAIGEELVTFDDGAPVSRRAIAGLGPPAFGANGAIILVPASDGLRVIDAEGASRDAVVKGAPVEAIFAAPNGKGWIVSTRGSIERWGPEGRIETLIARAPVARRLYADADGRILVRSSDGAWWESANGTMRRAGITAAAVDVAGRRWLGTEAGMIPLSGDFAVGRFERLPRAMARHIDEARATLGPPPCPRLPMSPLPAVSIVGGAGRGDSRGYADPAPHHTEWARTFAYLRVTLSWSLDPLPRATCIETAARRATIVREIDDRLARLWIRWRKARAASEAAADPIARFIADNEAARAASLIEALSELSPTEEESQ